MRQKVVRRSFTLTERDLHVIKSAVEKCGYVSDSEALRAIIRFFAERAPCVSSEKITTPPRTDADYHI
jgi:predicted Zn-ribbon and HTH transcriptional regulator